MDLKGKIIQAIGSAYDSVVVDSMVNICIQHYQNEFNWYGAELPYLQQRIEELELELMIQHEAFDIESRVQATVNPKRRSTF